MPDNLNVHSLWHTNASMLIAQGVDVRTVAGLLGHAQPSTTLDIYSHTFDKNKKLAQQKLAEAWGYGGKEKQPSEFQGLFWCARLDSNQWPSGSENCDRQI